MLLMKTEEPLEIEYACYDDEDNYEEFKQDILEKYDVKSYRLRKSRQQIKLFEKIENSIDIFARSSYNTYCCRRKPEMKMYV